ncbi:MAG: 1-deoxy-D-xylulose 5-phosphate reductoisomerase [Syntrophorhabdus sp. PtaU1.Bin002]|nr:MAG: 1-deoxy-D-xylulose 5-phosphate reductoisomerase [Syntrophorhabdus sp. PtaU1.Bin002]
MKKKVLVLGSTGSIGQATLDVIDSQRDTLAVAGLVCKDNAGLLNVQIERFKPDFACVYDAHMRASVEFPQERLFVGMEGIKELIGMDADIIVNAMPGSIGLEPTVEALKQNKTLALANKESLVMAGRVVRRLLGQGTGALIPVDSEHSALFQIMKGIDQSDVKTLIITASGGPFRDHAKTALENVKPEEALNHPTWKMGAKITLDSATLMNKGLEVIEARWLFDVEPEKIKVLVHPESIVHGIVELVDNSYMAYLAYPDMRIPISYALNEEKRRGLPFGRLDIEKAFTLTFCPPDMDRFPSLRLALDALAAGDGAVIAMNASNEVASTAFIDGKIKFTDIPILIERTLEGRFQLPIIEDAETVLAVHREATKLAEENLRRLNA